MNVTMPDAVHEDLAASLSGLTGLPVTAVPGGFRVRETGTHFIDVTRQIYNWRVTTTPVDCPLGYDRYWCYEGTDFVALLTALLMVAEWDGAPDTEPAGWKKNGQTQEIRHFWDSQ